MEKHLRVNSGGNRRLLSPSEEPPHLKSGSSGRPKSLLFSSSSRFNTASDKQVFIEGAMCSAKLYGLLYKYLPYNTPLRTVIHIQGDINCTLRNLFAQPSSKSWAFSSLFTQPTCPPRGLSSSMHPSRSTFPRGMSMKLLHMHPTPQQTARQEAIHFLAKESTQATSPCSGSYPDEIHK
eukprot:1160420-Pelagomonas_calceolata.AAC.10